MRRYIFLLFFMLVSIGTLSAQCTQRVRVMEYKGKGAKSPLANVEVVVGNAGSAVTDKNGVCNLRFRTLKPGDKVSVRHIDKDGYELLNPKMLEQWFVSRDPNEEFVIVMAESKLLKRERDKYLRATEKTMQRSMQQDEAVLERQLSAKLITKADYDKKVMLLRAEYNEKLDNIENYIERMVHSDINEIAEEERRIFDRVKRGDISGALSAYGKIDLIDSYKKQIEDRKNLQLASEKIDEARKRKDDERMQLFASVKRQYDLYQMAGGLENIESGFKLLHDFAYSDTTFYLPLLDYAYLCERNNRVDDALDALKYCRHTSDTTILLQADLLRAQTLTRRNQYKKILPEVEAAYRFMDSARIARNDNSLYLRERAYALTILCRSYTYLKEEEKGRNIRQRTVDVNREMFEWDESDFEAKSMYVDALYAVYNSLFTLDFKGSNQKYKNDPKVLECTSYLDCAISLQEELYNVNPAKSSAVLAFLHCEKAIELRNITRARGDSTQFDKIEAEHLKALEIYDFAYHINPKSYAHFYSDAYLNYGALYFDYNKFADKDKIIGLFLKAKHYEEENFEYQPLATRSEYAYILWALGYTYFMCGDYVNAEKSLQTAVNEIYPLYMNQPKKHWSVLRLTYISLMSVYGPDALNNPEKLAQIKDKLNSLQQK